jgi:histidinol-phosphatase (PHP family)
MQLANHHAHSHFSDGRLSPEDYLKNAIDQELLLYGFSDHAPIPDAGFGAMDIQDLPNYLQEVDRLKEQYGDRIQIYKSLEVDYIPEMINVESQHIRDADLDYTIGAVHYVNFFDDGRPWGFEASSENFERGIREIFQGDVQAAMSRYYELIREMVLNFCPDVVAHLDRIKKLNKGDRFFSEKEGWYRNEVIQTLEVIAGSGTVMEVNTKSFYKKELEDTYPGKWVLEISREMGIPVNIGSDAHHPDDITKGFDHTSRLLREVGYTTTRIFLDGIWQEVELVKPLIYTT